MDVSIIDYQMIPKSKFLYCLTIFCSGNMQGNATTVAVQVMKEGMLGLFSVKMYLKAGFAQKPALLSFFEETLSTLFSDFTCTSEKYSLLLHLIYNQQ